MDSTKKHTCDAEIIEVKAGKDRLHKKENLKVLFTVREPESRREYRLIRFTKQDSLYSAIQTRRRYGWITVTQTETNREPVLWEQFWERKTEQKETSQENAIFMNYLYIRNIFGSFAEIYKQDAGLKEKIKEYIVSCDQNEG